jgi:hypothetical protein
MKLFFIPVALCAMAVSACSNDTGFGDAAREATAPPPVRIAAITPDANFCSGVARQDSENAAFDAATKRRMYANSFRQCVVVYAVNGGGLRVAGTDGLPSTDAR